MVFVFLFLTCVTHCDISTGTDVTANGIISFFLIAEWYPIVCKYVLHLYQFISW